MEVSKEPEAACPICATPYNPPGAKWCKNCQAYKSRWRRFFSISPLVAPWVTATMALIPPVFKAADDFLHRDSHTTITFLSATPEKLTIRATNTGRRIAVVRGVQLRFHSGEIQPVNLLLYESNAGADPNVVPAGGTVDIGFVAGGFDTKKTREELEQSLGSPGQFVTVAVDVQESNSSKDPNLRERQDEMIAASSIVNFVMAKIEARRSP